MYDTVYITPGEGIILVISGILVSRSTDPLNLPLAKVNLIMEQIVQNYQLFLQSELNKTLPCNTAWVVEG